MVEPKKKKPKREAKKKPKQKQKQKQKQIQKVNVQVSSGGGGGGFVPIPTPAPAVDYNLLASFIRQPATVDQPLRQAVMNQPEINIPAFEQQPQPMLVPLRREISTQTGPLRPAPPTPSSPIYPVSSAISASLAKEMGYPSETSISENEAKVRPSKSKTYYKKTGFVEPGSVGKGEKITFEEDIFGRSMPKKLGGGTTERPVARKKTGIHSAISIFGEPMGGGSLEPMSGGEMSFI